MSKKKLTAIYTQIKCLLRKKKSKVNFTVLTIIIKIVKFTLETTRELQTKLFCL